MKLATSKPVEVLTVQPAGCPAQFDVMLLLKLNTPVIVSGLRISRERNVMLPPLLIVCFPLTQVTLSKIAMSFWLVMSGWLPFAPSPRMFWNVICDIADVALLMLTPGSPTALAGFVP